MKIADVQEQCCRLLWHCASLNPQAAALVACSGGFLSAILEVCTCHGDIPTVIALACGLLTTVASTLPSSANCAPLTAVVCKAMCTHQQHEVVLTQACGAASAICGEATAERDTSRQSAVDAGAVEVLVGESGCMAMYPESQTVQEVACGAVGSLAVEPSHATILVEHKAVRRVVSALKTFHSSSLMVRNGCHALLQLSFARGTTEDEMIRLGLAGVLHECITTHRDDAALRSLALTLLIRVSFGTLKADAREADNPTLEGLKQCTRRMTLRATDRAALALQGSLAESRRASAVSVSSEGPAVSSSSIPAT